MSLLLHPRQIEAVHAVLRTGSMTAAAELLRVTQPAVSRLVREFEASLQITLFKRVGNRITPTQDAVLLQPEIERHFVGLDRIARAAEEIREARKGTIRVAAVAALSVGVMNPAMRDFLAMRPSVQLRLHTDTSENIIRLVAMHRVDIGFISSAVQDTPGVRVHSLPEADAVCILPARHPLTRCQAIESRDLQGQRFVNLGQANPLRQRLDALLLNQDVRHVVTIESSLAASVSALVGLGLGVAVSDPFSLHEMKLGNVVVRPFLPRLPVRYFCILPGHQGQRRLVAALRGAVVKQMQAVSGFEAKRNGKTPHHDIKSRKPSANP